MMWLGPRGGAPSDHVDVELRDGTNSIQNQASPNDIGSNPQTDCQTFLGHTGLVLRGLEYNSSGLYLPKFDGNLSIYLHRNVCLVLLIGIALLLAAPLVRRPQKLETAQ